MIYILPTDTCFWIWCAIYDTKSYHKIYKLKKRDLKKPLAIMVEDFDFLEKYTSLNKEQINFLKNYEKPFSVITSCPNIEMMLNLWEDEFVYENKEIYKNISFRVANNEIQKNLIKEIWPIFLTSANISWKPEIYDINNAKEIFAQNKDITFLWENIVLDKDIKPSDIIEFIKESLEVKYLRKF